jgi:hypothetical protein
MDRQIPRKLNTRYVQIDSAYRQANDAVCDYSVFFDSLDQRRARIIKDVVGLQITRASVPKVHDNIIASMNIVNMHVLSSVQSQSTPVTLVSESELIQYLATHMPSVVLSVKVQKIQSSDTKKAWYGLQKNDTFKTVYKLSSSENRLLTSSSSFTGAQSFSGCYGLLVTSKPAVWDIGFPLSLDLQLAESHRILLKPGYYPTSSLMIAELFESFSATMGSSTIDPNLQFYNDWDDDVGASPQSGWSVYKEARGRWSLYFRSDKDHEIFFSREPGSYDMLQQMGLRGGQARNWARAGSERNPTHVFQMAKHSVSSNSMVSAAPTNTIIGRSSIPFSNIYELQFEQINLSPRRYVDILIDNIPSFSITNGQRQQDHFARIDLSSHKISYSSNINTSNQAILQDSFDESSSSDTYVVYERDASNEVAFDPVSLDHLNIKLIDNLGAHYTAERDHIIEVKLTVLGDAIAPFDFPVSDIGSVSPPHRKLVDMLEYTEYGHAVSKREKKKKKLHSPEIVVQYPSPIREWLLDNKVEVGASLATFTFVLYLARRFGAFRSAVVGTIHPDHSK